MDGRLSNPRSGVDGQADPLSCHRSLIVGSAPDYLPVDRDSTGRQTSYHAIDLWSLGRYPVI